MNELMKYIHEHKHIRTTVLDGEVWAVAKDVCEALGHRDHHYSVASLGADQKKRIKAPTNNGMHTMVHVNEPAIVLLVNNGKTEKCRIFRKWFCQKGSSVEVVKTNLVLSHAFMEAFADYERAQKPPAMDGRSRKLAGIVDPEDEHDATKRIRNVISEAGAIRETLLYRKFPELNQDEARAIVDLEVRKGSVNRVKGHGPQGQETNNKTNWLVWKAERLKRAEEKEVIVSEVDKALVETLLIRRSPCSERDVSRAIPHLTLSERNAIISTLVSENKIKRKAKQSQKGARPSIILTWIG